MKADLHVHSTASDGTLPPSAVVERARDNGVEVLALADHDSVAGVPEARERASQLGIRLVAACELSAVSGSHDVHVLAYFLDPDDPELLALLSSLRNGRLKRARAMVSALSDAGYSVSLDEVLRIAGGGRWAEATSPEHSFRPVTPPRSKKRLRTSSVEGGRSTSPSAAPLPPRWLVESAISAQCRYSLTPA